MFLLEYCALLYAHVEYIKCLAIHLNISLVISCERWRPAKYTLKIYMFKSIILNSIIYKNTPRYSSSFRAPICISYTGISLVNQKLEFGTPFRADGMACGAMG
jgi:hypothetical protein